MSYLYSNDEFGNTIVRPGALIDLMPLEAPMQRTKYELSRYGLRYSLEQKRSLRRPDRPGSGVSASGARKCLPARKLVGTGFVMQAPAQICRLGFRG